MKTFKITYEDDIEAESLEHAYEILLTLLDSDVKYDDVSAFEFEEISDASWRYERSHSWKRNGIC